ncbi:MAG: helix-turn-helix transcriptional regulator [Clostridia bacterium]|nr:helix-turn-helix transcriptional regulator [Clostridia bacterium]
MSDVKGSRPIMNEELVASMTQRLIDEHSLMDLAGFFKLFSDESRLKILYLLTMNEMCVSDIAATLDMNQSTVSHQLKILRNSRVVKYRRDAKIVYYSLDDDHIGQILLQGMLHVSEY